jgi:hypothetical protein
MQLLTQLPDAGQFFARFVNTLLDMRNYRIRDGFV